MFASLWPGSPAGCIAAGRASYKGLRIIATQASLADLHVSTHNGDIVFFAWADQWSCGCCRGLLFLTRHTAEAGRRLQFVQCCASSRVIDGRIRGFGRMAALFQVIAAGSVTAIQQP